MKPVNNVPPTLTDTTYTADLTNQVLEIAKAEQAKEMLVDLELTTLKESVKSSSQTVVLDPPKSTISDESSGESLSKMKGDFFDAMIVAMTELAALMGDMADSILVELQFKKTQTKQLLEEKLIAIKEREEQRLAIAEMEKARADSKRKGGIFSSAVSFAFAAAEVVGGAALIATGTVTGQPALIAGGTMLVAAGALEIAAEVVSITGGSDKTAENLRQAAMGLMILGMATATYGTMSGTATAVSASKKALQEGSEALAKKTLKNTSDKMSKEIAETATEKMAKDLDDISKKVISVNGKNTTEKAITEAVEEYFSNFMEAVTKEAAKNSVEMMGEKTAKDATEKAVRETVEMITKNAEDVKKTTNALTNTLKGIATGKMAADITTAGYRLHIANQQYDFDKREIKLNHEIEELEARLVEIMAKQEWANKMIQLLQESWIKAINGPIDEALKVMNSTIQDHGAITRRISTNV